VWISTEFGASAPFSHKGKKYRRESFQSRHPFGFHLQITLAIDCSQVVISSDAKPIKMGNSTKPNSCPLTTGMDLVDFFPRELTCNLFFQDRPFQLLTHCYVFNSNVFGELAANLWHSRHRTTRIIQHLVCTFIMFAWITSVGFEPVLIRGAVSSARLP
jgi:hypothetical protein